MISKNSIVIALKELGLSSGDNIMIHTSLKQLGHIENVSSSSKEDYCRTLYECFNEILKIEENIGTLAVPIFTHNYVKLKEVFELEKTKSEVGIFTEYVRNLNGTIRTLHPITSVCIRGKNKKLFTNVSTSGYGLNSFFDKFAKLDNAKVLYFGADINHSTYVHHVEHMIGASYVYNKAYFEPNVIVNNKVVDKPFFNSVRYLGKGIEPDYSKLQENLILNNKIKIGYLEHFKIMVINVEDLMTEVYDMLQNDQCVLLKEKYYVTE